MTLQNAVRLTAFLLSYSQAVNKYVLALDVNVLYLQKSERIRV